MTSMHTNNINMTTELQEDWDNVNPSPAKWWVKSNSEETARQERQEVGRGGDRVKPNISRTQINEQTYRSFCLREHLLQDKYVWQYKEFYK